MKKMILLGALMMSSLAMGSTERSLTSLEVDTLNNLLKCPKELAEIMKVSEWIGSGAVKGNARNTQTTYNFYTRSGMVSADLTGVLTISAVKIDNPAMDAPDTEYICSLSR